MYLTWQLKLRKESVKVGAESRHNNMEILEKHTSIMKKT